MDPPRTGDRIVQSTNLKKRAAKAEVLRNHPVVRSTRTLGANKKIDEFKTLISKKSLE